MNAQKVIAQLTRENDRLARRNIELELTVDVLEAELLARVRVRQGTDLTPGMRTN